MRDLDSLLTITHEIGSTTRKVISVHKDEDNDGVAEGVDLRNKNIIAKIRRNSRTTEEVTRFQVIEDNAGAGVIELIIPSDEDNLKPGRYWYDVSSATNATPPVVKKIISGNLDVLAGGFR